MSKNGFTLVELSIVVVLIGLLVAGIAGGSAMIEQARIRSVISDINSYKTAVNNFRAKYNGFPGDIVSGDSYFPTCSTTQNLCNGSGHGLILVVLGNNTDGVRPALRELSLAGMISASIPIVDGLHAPLIPGTTAPASKIDGVGYMLSQDATGSFYTFTSNALVIGKPDGTPAGYLFAGGLTPIEAFSIDVKLDDGIIISSNESNSVINYAMASIKGPPTTACPSTYSPGEPTVAGWGANLGGSNGGTGIDGGGDGTGSKGNGNGNIGGGVSSLYVINDAYAASITGGTGSTASPTSCVGGAASGQFRTVIGLDQPVGSTDCLFLDGTYNLTSNVRACVSEQLIGDVAR